MLHPTTPHALPLARISSGNISAGYSHGTVNQVAPKMAVNRNTKKVAAIPAPTQSSEISIASSKPEPELKEQIWRKALSAPDSSFRTNLRTSFGRGTNSSVLSDARKATDEEGANSHADGAPVKGPPTAYPIECEDTDQSGELACLSAALIGVHRGHEITYHVGNVIETGHP